MQFLQNFWRNMPLTFKGITVIALPLTLLLISFAYLYTEEQIGVDLENKLRAILKNQQNMIDMHAQLLEASTAIKDYLLTGDKAFLSLYEKAEKKELLLLRDLEGHIKDAEANKSFNRIRPLVNQSLTQLKSISKANLEMGATEALIAKFRTQTETLNALRSEIELFDSRESVLIQKNLALVNAQRKRYVQLNFYLAICSIVGSIFAVWFFSNTIVNRVSRLRDNAKHLANGEPMLLDDSSKDELGQLSEELNHASQLLAKSTKEAHNARIEAEQASKEKSLFLSRTSHELRTPLNAILGFAYLLENDLPQSKQRDSASLIRGAGEHLLKLINEVLDIAKIESGDATLNLTPVSVYALLEEAIQYIRPLGKIRDIEIESNYPQDLYVMADHQKLVQVVLNLLSNALKYGPPSATVYLKAFLSADKVIIEVLDEGTGIPKAMRSRVFTPFDRLGAENSITEGTGLGLALSKQIVTSLNGSIHIAEDKSLFWLELPACSGEARQNTISKGSTFEPIETTHAKHPILYVEDNASNRALLEAVIARHKGLRLYTANTLKQAYQLIEDINPELFLLDLHLPDGSGATFLNILRNDKRYSKCPVFILSADAMPATIQQLNAQGATGYFTKPLDIAKFNLTLKELFNKTTAT